MKVIFFFLTPLVTIALFSVTTYNYFDPQNIIISTEHDSKFIKYNYLDGHELRVGDGWNDYGYANRTHVFSTQALEVGMERWNAFASTFGYTGSTVNSVTTGTSTSTDCAPAGTTYTKGTSLILAKGPDTNSACTVLTFLWDISPISVFSTITDVTYRSDITAVTSAGNCDITELTYKPSLVGGQTIWEDVTGIISDIDYITDNSWCTAVANDNVLDLGPDADEMVQNQLPESWFAIGIHYNNMVRGPSNHQQTFGASAATQELQVTYTAGLPPTPGSDCEDPITTLHYTTLTNTTVNLAWTTPAQNSVTITGYQINYTTPFGIPLTILTGGNDTGTTATTYTVSNLTYNTPYSFRVQPWTNSTCHSPADGNIINAFTNPTVTPGSLDTGSFNATNPLSVPCTFVRTDLNSTSLLLNVTYPNSYNASINFHYKYAMTNNTYTGFASTIVDSNYNMSSFQFNGVDNEIIDVLFTDQNTNDTCKYLITQTNFKLLELVNNFNNGDYGTRGQFGVFDIGTLIIIILAMIGFNRVNESVGYVFAIAIIGITAALGFITWPTIIVAALAMLGLYAVASTRKE